MKNRLHPEFWVPDAYLLRKLAACIDEVVRRKLARPGAAVVDFGCGDAPYRPLFDARQLRYIGCDLQGSDAEVVFEPGQRVPVEDGTADAVVSFQVLEHVWDLGWYLRESHRMLKDDGVLILSTHGVWPYHPHPTDFRRWTRPGLNCEVEVYDFTVHESHALVGPLAWTMLFQSMALGHVLGKIPVVGKLLTAIVSTVSNLVLGVADRITPRQWAEENSSIYLIVATKTRRERI